MKNKILAFAILIISFATAHANEAPVKKGYAPVNGLKMYYEIHGSGGTPLILLHGAYSSIGSSFGALIPGLSKTRQVIAVDLQGHGRTGDANRDITYEGLADDVSAFLKHLNIDKADVFGFSMGAGVAFQLVNRHPQQVRKLVLTSGSYNTAGCYQEMWDMIPSITPEVFEGTPFKAEYDSLAPNKKDWPNLVAKLKKLDMTVFDWKAESVKNIKSPVLLIIADGDIVKPDHAVEMFKLLGGGIPADLKGQPASQLAILPGASHMNIMLQTTQLLAMVPAFLDAPVKK
jgi:pimeloyl-ACP methyl ester carboxylesterase